MHYRGLKEIRRLLWNHEDSIQGNKKSIFSSQTKIHENEQHTITQVVTIMSTLIQCKRKIVIVEVECNIIWNLVINMSKGDQFKALN